MSKKRGIHTAALMAFWALSKLQYSLLSLDVALEVGVISIYCGKQSLRKAERQQQTPKIPTASNKLPLTLENKFYRESKNKKANVIL